MHWRRKWQPTPVFLPGESQGQRSLVGCRLWGHTELDTTGDLAAAETEKMVEVKITKIYIKRGRVLEKEQMEIKYFIFLSTDLTD